MKVQLMPSKNRNLLFVYLPVKIIKELELTKGSELIYKINNYLLDSSKSSITIKKKSNNSNGEWMEE